MRYKSVDFGAEKRQFGEPKQTERARLGGLRGVGRGADALEVRCGAWCRCAGAGDRRADHAHPPPHAPQRLPHHGLPPITRDVKRTKPVPAECWSRPCTSTTPERYPWCVDILGVFCFVAKLSCNCKTIREIPSLESHPPLENCQLTKQLGQVFRKFGGFKGELTY